VAKAG